MTSWAGDSEQITPAMETLRSAPLGQRRAAYERGRVEEELVWYRGKAIDNDRQARRWSARSAWVAREVSYWRQHKPIDHLLVVLTGGKVVWDDALGDFDWDKTTALPRGCRVPSGRSRGSSTFGGRDIARRERHRAETQARLAASRYLAVQARLRSDTQPDLGMLLSVAAARMDNNAEARGSLFEQVQSRRDVSGLLVGHDTEVTAVANQTVLGELEAAHGQDASVPSRVAP